MSAKKGTNNCTPTTLTNKLNKGGTAIRPMYAIADCVPITD